MRTIIKNIRLPVDGTPYDFRLKKLDAFSGVSLLRMLSRTPQPGASAGEETAEGSEKPDSLQSVLFALPEAELKSLMTACLNHAEVLLPAGYQPVMTGSEWAWPELEPVFLHDPFPEGAGEHDRLIYSLGTTRGLAGTIEIQPEWIVVTNMISEAPLSASAPHEICLEKCWWICIAIN